MLDTKYTKEETKKLNELREKFNADFKIALENSRKAQKKYNTLDLSKKEFSDAEKKIITDYKNSVKKQSELIREYSKNAELVRRAAFERTIKNYKTEPEKLIKALKQDLEERLIAFTAFEQRELSAKFQEELYKRYSPYLDFLSDFAPEYEADFMLFFENNLTNAYKNKEIIAKAEQLKAILLNDYSPLRQGTLTNEASKITPSKKEFKINMISETAKFTKGDFTVSFSHFNEIAGLKTSTHQLFDACIRELTLRGLQNRTVAFHIDDYMALRGLKDKKTAREQVERDLETLFDARYSFKQKNKNKSRDFMDFRIITQKGIKNGIISVTFTPEFINLIESYNIMLVHKLLFKLDNKKYPCAYYFLRKISEHKNMNYGKDTANIISVTTLLKSVECVEHGIPSYEEVAKSDRHYDTRIIEPFERNMDALDEVFTWEYCHSNGVALTDEELQNFNYEIFSNLLIKIFWRNYPERELKPKKLPAKKKENKISNSDKK